jgi:CRP-like cAMP-binding protein
MEYNELKALLQNCPDLEGLDEPSRALLFWRGVEEPLVCGNVVYAEGDLLDDTFSVLLRGELALEKGGNVIGRISDQAVFGEMAYFTRTHERTATVRVASPQASIFRMKLTLADLQTNNYAPLKSFLGAQSWVRLVDTAQSAI